MNSAPPHLAAQSFVIEAGSIFLFDAILTPGVGFERRLARSRRAIDKPDVVLRSHAKVTEAIEKAEASEIFGDCSGVKAFAAEHEAGLVDVRLQRDSAALSTTDALVLTLEDARLSRTLLLVGLNVQLHEVTVDEIIALTQSAGAGADRSDETARPMISVSLGNRHERTLGEVLGLRENLVELVRRFRKEVTFETGRSWCCEIRRVGAYATAEELFSEPVAARPLYGLLHGDEGWRFVPAGHAREELGRVWGSRDYVAVLVQESGVLVLNLEERRAQDRAQGRARSRALAGLTMPHLDLAASGVAGIDHGALFALQRSLLRLLAARELESRLFGASKPLAPPSGVWARLRSWLRALRRAPALFRVLYRGPESRFYKDLLRVSGGSVSELANLQSFMDERVGATPLLQRLNRAADLVDIELRDRRLTVLNWLVVFLTVLTIAIGVLQLVLN